MPNQQVQFSRLETILLSGLTSVGCSPEQERSMSSDCHNLDRASQQDARAWSTFTATKYTAAKRQISSALAQGFLGDRFSARDLIAVLHNHPLVGADKDGPVLGDNGYYADRPWSFNGQTDYIELALDE